MTTSKVVCSSVFIEIFGKTKLLIFKGESKDFKVECQELKRDARVCLVEAVSCKVVTKQSNNSQFRKGLKGVGNRFICEVLRSAESGGIQVRVNSKPSKTQCWRHLEPRCVGFDQKCVEMKTFK